MSLDIYQDAHKMKNVLQQPVTDVAVTETLQRERRTQMKDQQHDSNMTNRMSGVQHNVTSLHAKGGHKQSALDVMLFSILTGLRIQEIVNLRYQDLSPKAERETGNRKRFRFPETTGGKDGK